MHAVLPAAHVIAVTPRRTAFAGGPSVVADTLPEREPQLVEIEAPGLDGGDVRVTTA